jgi:hypothetical protein
MALERRFEQHLASGGASQRYMASRLSRTLMAEAAHREPFQLNLAATEYQTLAPTCRSPEPMPSLQRLLNLQ